MIYLIFWVNNLNSINTTDIAYENNYNLNQNTNDFIDSILDEKSSDNEIQNGEITDEKYINKCINENKKQIKILTSETKISLLFEQLNLKYDYKKLENVEKIYIPLKYFLYNNLLQEALWGYDKDDFSGRRVLLGHTALLRPNQRHH